MQYWFCLPLYLSCSPHPLILKRTYERLEHGNKDLEWLPCNEQLNNVELWFGTGLVTSDAMEVCNIMSGMERVNAENDHSYSLLIQELEDIKKELTCVCV